MNVISRVCVGLIFVASLSQAFADDLISVLADGKRYKTTTLSHLELNLGNISDRWSQFGGSLDLARQEGTGYFRVEQINGIWALIDPEGYVFISIGVNSVNDGGRHLRKQFNARFNDSSEWLEHVDGMMEDLHFNTYANWSDHEKLKVHERPYVVRLNFIAAYGKQKGLAKMGYGQFQFEDDLMPVFDRDFEAFAMEQAEQFSKYADDPYLLGVFSDNELPFSKVKGCIQRYLTLEPQDEGRRYAENWMAAQGIREDKITSEHDQLFMEQVFERYFSVVGGAIKTYLPNHLYLGTRFHGMALRNDALFRVAGKYVDVVSINYYHRWTPEYDRINKWADLAGKPLIITEWYAKSEDTGLDNTEGAGFLVETQQARAYFYENYTLGLLRNRNVVGWHWFRYIDDLKQGVEANKGILKQNFEPYEELADSMRSINQHAYSLRRQLLWSESRLLLDQPEIAD